MANEYRPTYLVTGATRGIGRELVKILSTSNPDATVIAAIRNLEAPQAKSLQSELPNLIIVKIDSEIDTDPVAAAKTLISLGITKIDTIFANAAILLDADDAINTSPEKLRHLFTVNAIAPLLLFQAFKPLLESSTTPPPSSSSPSKFVFVSTIAASLGKQTQMPYKVTSYGGVKAAANFFMVRLAVENPNITTFAVHPGVVLTDMATFAIEKAGQTVDTFPGKSMTITSEESAKAIIKTANEATLEGTSGRFIDVTNGQELPW